MRLIAVDPTDLALADVVIDNRDVVDVTDDVVAIYELVRNSLDWTSGFLSVEDCKPLLNIAELLDLPDLPDVRAQVEAWKVAEQQAATEREVQRTVYRGAPFAFTVPLSWTIEFAKQFSDDVVEAVQEWYQKASPDGVGTVDPLPEIPCPLNKKDRTCGWSLAMSKQRSIHDESFLSAVRVRVAEHYFTHFKVDPIAEDAAKEHAEMRRQENLELLGDDL